MQRIIVSKTTKQVIDVGSKNLQYDGHTYDNMDFADGMIPAGEDFRKHVLDDQDQIVNLPAQELEDQFRDEWKARAIGRIQASPNANGGTQTDFDRD